MRRPATNCKVYAGGALYGPTMSDYTIIKLRDVKDAAPGFGFDVIRVGPGTTRNFEAGDDGLELLAFGAPVSVGNDSEIKPGWWSD